MEPVTLDERDDHEALETEEEEEEVVGVGRADNEDVTADLCI